MTVFVHMSFGYSCVVRRSEFKTKTGLVEVIVTKRKRDDYHTVGGVYLCRPADLDLGRQTDER